MQLSLSFHPNFLLQQFSKCDLGTSEGPWIPFKGNIRQIYKYFKMSVLISNTVNTDTYNPPIWGL